MYLHDAFYDAFYMILSTNAELHGYLLKMTIATHLRLQWISWNLKHALHTIYDVHELYDYIQYNTYNI